MRTIPTFRASGLRLWRDRGGTIGVVFAMTLPVLALAAGFGLNTVQLMTVRSNLQNALDSAVTSTARDLTTGVFPREDARENVGVFLFANGDRAFASVDRIKLDSVDVDQTTGTVSAAASVEVDVLFPLFGANNHQQVAVNSAARYSDKKIEVVMMLDVTGSMAPTWHSDKIGDLKRAATKAVGRLLGGRAPAGRDPRVRVAIVPYADAVNTGQLANTVYYETRHTTGEPPAMDDAKAVSARRRDTCATERKGSRQFSDASPFAAMVNRDSRLRPGYCPSVALQPLTSDARMLKEEIAALGAGGHTAGHIGIQWSWYMLSPRWRRALASASAPGEYNDDKVAKVAILMTDGLFNTAYAGVGRHENTTGAQAARSRDYSERLCRAMKREKIEIYTIGFMLHDANAKSVLRNCASPDTQSVKHYYEAADGGELDAAYQNIIRNVERLAVIK